MDSSHVPPTRQRSDTSVPHDSKDFCDLAMHQALEVQKVALDMVARWNSCILDSIWFLPEFSNLQEAAAQAVACYAELQMSWLSLLTPQVLTDIAAPSVEVLERSMDIAMGVCFPALGGRASFSIISGGRVSSAEEQPERVEAVAISVQAA